MTAIAKTIAGDSIQSAVYVDMENLAGKGKELLIELLTKWPVKAPKPSVVHLYVRADQVGLWSVWGEGRLSGCPHRASWRPTLQQHQRQEFSRRGPGDRRHNRSSDRSNRTHHDNERRQRFPRALFGDDLASGHAVSGRSAALHAGRNRRYGEAVRDNSFICAAGNICMSSALRLLRLQNLQSNRPTRRLVRKQSLGTWLGKSFRKGT